MSSPSYIGCGTCSSAVNSLPDSLENQLTKTDVTAMSFTHTLIH